MRIFPNVFNVLFRHRMMRLAFKSEYDRQGASQEKEGKCDRLPSYCRSTDAKVLSTKASSGILLKTQ